LCECGADAEEAKRFKELATEGGTQTPKGEREARGVAQAEKEGKLLPGSSVRGEKGGLDFESKLPDGTPQSVDVKSPIDPKLRPLPTQANDIGSKAGLYSPGTTVVVDLRDVPPGDKAAFKRDVNAANTPRPDGTTTPIVFVNE
jgi:hypothetical protein